MLLVCCANAVCWILINLTLYTMTCKPSLDWVCKIDNWHSHVLDVQRSRDRDIFNLMFIQSYCTLWPPKKNKNFPIPSYHFSRLRLIQFSKPGGKGMANFSWELILLFFQHFPSLAIGMNVKKFQILEIWVTILF